MNIKNSPEYSPEFSLKGQCLIAMPGMGDPRFMRSVILICSHLRDGCMGFIINQPVISPTFNEVLDELGLDDHKIDLEAGEDDIQIHRGGPVEKGRGFVLHSRDFSSSSTAKVTEFAGLSATLDVLRVISGAASPTDVRMFLGYSGWSAGMLEQEIAENAWLTVAASRKLIFQTESALIYDAALAELGISEATLSSSAGHA